MDANKLAAACRDIINSYAGLQLPNFWGEGKRAAADGTKYDLYDQNLLASYHIRYGGYGGMAYLYATRACATPCVRYGTFAAGLDALAVATVAGSASAARSRPTPAALLELHTLQALDATLAGASLREMAEGLFGADAIAADWHKDSALRARVRRLVVVAMR